MIVIGIALPVLSPAIVIVFEVANVSTAILEFVSKLNVSGVLSSRIVFVLNVELTPPTVNVVIFSVLKDVEVL